NTTEVAVEEGLVWVTGSDGQGATVPAGYQLTVRIGEPLNVEPQPDLEPTAPPVAEATSPTPTLAGATPTPQGTRQPGPLIAPPFISPTPRRSEERRVGKGRSPLRSADRYRRPEADGGERGW